MQFSITMMFIWTEAKLVFRPPALLAPTRLVSPTYGAIATLEGWLFILILISSCLSRSWSEALIFRSRLKAPQEAHGFKASPAQHESSERLKEIQRFFRAGSHPLLTMAGYWVAWHSI